MIEMASYGWFRLSPSACHRSGMGRPCPAPGRISRHSLLHRPVIPGAAATGIFGINARGDFVGIWLPDLISAIEHGFACPKRSQYFTP